MKKLDAWLNLITMYKLVLYTLMIFVGLAATLSLLSFVRYPAYSIIGSTAWLMGLCWLANILFSWAFDLPANNDSAYITGLILALIVTPYASSADLGIYIWAPLLAMASKHLLSVGKQHIFNPAALAVVVTALAFHQSASWWVGTGIMMPFILIGGYLIVRKIRRTDVFVVFIVTSLLAIVLSAFFRHSDLLNALKTTLLSSPLIFFSTIMLTEPATMPPKKHMRLAYGILVGLLFLPQVHIGSLYSTPELALVTGNLLFYVYAGRRRHVLTLVEKIQVTPTVVDFVFSGDRPVFIPGQYFEWTVPHAHHDSRGQRRYFTVASSPTEKNWRIGVKFYNPASTYKVALYNLQADQTAIASQQDGDFTLPKNSQQKLAFLAGGIGITPFRSMIKYLLDTNQSRDIVLLYANTRSEEIAYQDVLAQAQQAMNFRVVHALTDETQIPRDWTGQRGKVTAQMIETEIPDYYDRLFYISGPQAMVSAYVKLLRSLRVKHANIKTDYFPGFA